MSERTRVFISYSHADRRFLDRLHVFLKGLEHQGRVDWWDDTRLTPGSDWREKIREAIDTARVAVLLVSADFFASDFIGGGEVTAPLATTRTQNARSLYAHLPRVI